MPSSPISSVASASLSVSSSDSGPLRSSPAAAAMRLRVVLLRPSRGTNVGAVCRAMKNMGASDLVVVEGRYDAEEARRTSVHADDVLASLRSAATLDEALASSTFVVGTTSRSRPWKVPVDPIGDVLREARERAPGGCVALVFGPEDHGLSNDELARCHRLAFIPTADAYASLNLAQAAVICLYEWLRTADEPRTSVRPAATAASDRAQEDALADFGRMLEEIGFLDGDQADRVLATVRSMFARSGLDDREVRILRGIVRQVRWATGGRPRDGG